MNAGQQDEYIVQALRMQGAMYEDDARKFLAEHDSRVRVEVLREAKAEVVAWLAKKAHEDTPVFRLADKVHRGAIRLFLGIGEEATAAAATATPDFFQAGHTYTDAKHETDWKFRVDLVTTAPDNGKRTALGWRHFNGQWEPYAYFEDDWDVQQYVGYTDVTETGDGPIADFFTPGRSYLVDGHEYRCRAVDTHPVKQEREAWGWFHRGDDRWQHRRFYDTEYTRATPHTGGEAGRG